MIVRDATLTQFQVFVFFDHVTFSHEKVLYLDSERARSFIKILSASAATSSVVLGLLSQTEAAELAIFDRVKLVEAQGLAVKASKRARTNAYLFNYPYASTPNFFD